MSYKVSKANPFSTGTFYLDANPVLWTVSTWFQNRKRRYLDTLNEYQVLSKKHPDLVYNYHTYKKFIASEKSSHKKKRK